jgi:hypothetical protein
MMARDLEQSKAIKNYELRIKNYGFVGRLTFADISPQIRNS